MSDTKRTLTFLNILREARKTWRLADYSDETPAEKLITLAGNVSDLCWEIAAASKVASPYNKIFSAESIKYNATNIINICVDELKNLGRGDEDAIELITTDGALWSWSLDTHPLNTLDQNTPTTERIQSLYTALGDLTNWWPNKTSPQKIGTPDAERERTFVNLAYEATCAIIATTHTN